MLIKRTLPHQQLSQPHTQELETTGIQLYTGEANINIYSVCIRPGDNFSEELNQIFTTGTPNIAVCVRPGDNLSEELNQIFTNVTPNIAAGDYNAKHMD